MTTERPVIMLADPDAIDRDEIGSGLRERYAPAYRILTVGGIDEAADALRRLSAPVAVVIADARLSGGRGAELLAMARSVHPRVRRLLTTLRGTDLIGAEDLADRYLSTPFRALDQDLYPAVDDALAVWSRQATGTDRPLRLLSRPVDRRAYEIRDFLSRNLVPYEWQEADRPPAVLLADGRELGEPSFAQLARELGLTQEASRDAYDLIVIGGGPAGLAGAVYAACEGLSVVIVEDDAPGGQAGTTSRIENYLGFPEGLSGAELAHRALAQARRFGVEWLNARVATSLHTKDQGHVIGIDDGTELTGRAVLVATGMKWRRLEAAGIEDLVNAGVYYGSCLSDAPQTKGQDIVMVGAGNSAGQAALHFAQYARTVTLAIRNPSLRESVMSGYLVDRIEGTPQIIVRPETEIMAAHGQGRLSSLSFRSRVSGAVEQIPTSWLYILIGTQPCTDWLPVEIARDQYGYLLTGANVPRPWPLSRDPLLMETSLPGVFAAGDVRSGSVKRVGSAVGQGAVSIHSITQYLAGGSA